MNSMASNISPEEQLRAENVALRLKLEEAEDTLRAIRTGDVDSIVVETEDGPQLFTLQGLDAESNHFRGDILAQVSDAVIAVDAEQRVIYLNAAAERQYHLSTSDALGRQLGEIYTQHWPHTATEAVMWATLHERGEWRGETIHRTHDGRDIAVETSVTALRGASGAPIGYVGVSRDITERKRTDLELQHISVLLDTLLQTAPIGFCFLDRGRRFVRINERLAEMNGISAEAHLGRQASEILPNLDEALRDVTDRILATGEAVLNHEFSGETPAAPGVTRFWNESWYPVRDGTGEVMGFGAVVEEITARKQAEAALREADGRKDEFLATLAHELRNPLAPIRTGVHLLRKVADRNPRIDALAAMMERQVSHMVRLVDDLLDVGRVATGKLLLQKESVLLSSVLTDAVEAARPLVKERGLALTLTLPPAPIELDLDPVRITQVISNLLNNAAKFTDSTGRIGVTVAHQPNEVVISVSDTGVGLAAEDLPRIFDLFAQVNPSRDHTQGGLGIGLALSKRLAEMHGGTLHAISAGVGLGSEFVLRLPLLSQAASTATPSQADDPVPSATSRRILVVDDSRDGADMLSMLLRDDGHDLQVAYDGESALTVAEVFRPEVVLLDIGLPMMNGYEVCRHMRARTWAKGLVVIALTGWGAEEDRRRGQHAGIDHYMVKPVAPAALRQILATPAGGSDASKSELHSSAKGRLPAQGCD